jgi:mannose/fructose/N-acetylgalactosamine-specific phosphotransferase system component IIC
VNLLPFILLGALFGLDVVTFPQAMLSRPIVAATVSGALAGHADLGLLLGATLELIALETLPFGASRYPEWGSAAVAGGALMASAARQMSPHGVSAALAMSVLASLATAWDLVRGAALTAAALLIFRPLVDVGVGLWSVNPRLTRAVVVGIASTVAVGAVWKVFHTTRGAIWFFLVGLATGAVVLAYQ